MHIGDIIVIFLCHFLCSCTPESGQDVNTLDLWLHGQDLPRHHLERHLNAFPRLREMCKSSTKCAAEFLSQSPSQLCWGYESDCLPEHRFGRPSCSGGHATLGSIDTNPVDTFFLQADFGYVRDQRNSLRVLCTPRLLTDSSLECSHYLQFCRGRNLFFDFRDLLNRTELIRYHTNVLKAGHVAGFCRLDSGRLTAELDHMGALQSWAPELRFFRELPAPIFTDGQCDVLIETPTYIMKIDSSYNMYHHFCDFFNLYTTIFANMTHPSAFSRDRRILIWETYQYDSPFAETFKAFSEHPIWTLNNVRGKRVCFRNLVLPLLPRMIFGLYYNTPVIHNCEGSGLFRAFSEFILQRLHIPLLPPIAEHTVRITFLSRRTRFRRVLDEESLLEEIAANRRYQIRRVSFETLAFREQLAITRNTDILIGMHGAGLTHLLFLPNWATIFELYNCKDPNCYKDLARLRGVNYITWERDDLVYPQDEGQHPEGGAHAKFTNYSFDRREFSRLVDVAAQHVLQHSDFGKFHSSRTTKHDEF